MGSFEISRRRTREIFDSTFEAWRRIVRHHFGPRPICT
jgi:hypothetical protein